MELGVHRVWGQSDGPHLLILAGVHGDEFEPMVAARELIATIKAEQLCGTLTIVPVVNEAAFLRGNRVAEDELDLARTFPGSLEGSITQRVAHATTQLIREADFMIDLHTGGTNLAVLPLTGYMMHSDVTVLHWQRRMARAFGLPIIWGSSAELDGRSLSVCRDAQIPAIYAEYMGSATCQEAGIAAYVRGCRQVMADLQMLRGEPLLPHEEPLCVEDTRPQIGHMQICNPSPATGLWRTQVALGDRVAVGDCLGHVSDVLGHHVQPVTAHEGGIVIVLRTFPRVLAGDSLAVILEQA